MDDRLLLGLYDDVTNVEAHSTLLRYFQELTSSPDGWKICATDFAKRVHSSDEVKFFSLRVMEQHARQKHAYSSDDDILAFRRELLSWLQPLQMQHEEKVFIKKKMAQIFGLVFVVDYPSKWPDFFTDLLNCVEMGSPAVAEMFLRILLAIDEEVVDRQVIHTAEENVRNTSIKDTMRDHHVHLLVDCWYQMLVANECDQVVICSLVLEVIGKYISWIDINLIANDRFVGLILKYLSAAQLRESAIDCLHEIVSKGMEPLSKLNLVESFFKVLVEVGILTTAASMDQDVDFEAKVSKFLNGIGVALVASWSKLVKGGQDESAKVVLEAIETKLPYLYRYLSDEDDGVSEPIITFAVQYVGIMKRCSNLSDTDRAHLQSLLFAVINKLKYDEGYKFGSEGEEEASFMEYRKELKVLFDNIVQIDQDMVLQTAHSLLSTTLASLHTQTFMNVEVAIRVLYMLGGVIVDKQYGVPNSPWQLMMSMMVSSELCNYNHSAVIIQYYETVVRYEKFFTVNSQCIVPLMKSFVGSNGLRSPNKAVRSRLSYLFVRFVKGVKLQISCIAEELLEDLKEIFSNLTLALQTKEYFSGNELIFLYEAAGILVASSIQLPENKAQMMKSLLDPIVTHLKIYFDQMAESANEEVAQNVHFLMSFASRLTKVFTNYQQVKQCGCLECFAEVLPVILHGLEVQRHKELVHSGVRQYLHRMVICLEDELLKYVPMTFSLLLKDCKSQDIQDFVPLLNQLIVKYKLKIFPCLNEFFMPAVQTINRCLSEPYDPLDREEERQHQSLQKCYYLFISSLATNEMTGVISNQGLENVERVLEAVLNGAVNFPDPSVQKICFGIIKKLVDCWAAEGALPGFVEYMYQHIIPACFMAPLKRTFDFNDGHAYLTLNELASVLKVIILKRGNEAVLYLQNCYLPSLKISPHFVIEFLSKLQESESRVLKPYLKVFFSQLRTLHEL